MNSHIGLIHRFYYGLAAQCLHLSALYKNFILGITAESANLSPGFFFAKYMSRHSFPLNLQITKYVLKSMDRAY